MILYDIDMVMIMTKNRTYVNFIQRGCLGNKGTISTHLAISAWSSAISSVGM